MEGDSWLETMRAKRYDIDLLRSWASMTGQSKLRDLLSVASHELQESIRRHTITLHSIPKEPTP